MRRHLLALPAGVAAMMIAGAAFAQAAPVTGTVTVNGTVGDRCLFTSDSAVVLNIGEMAFTTGATSQVGHYDASRLDTQQATLAGWCNGTAANMTVQAFPMLNTTFTGSVPSGFENRVDYTATATASSISKSATDSTLTPTAGAPTPVGIFTSNILVTFSSSATPGGGLLIAGPYQGSVQVTLSPTN